MKELKQCIKCHTMKNIEGEVCARCGSIEQEIMEMFDEEFAIYNSDQTKSGKEIQCDPEFVKSFISHIITLVQNDCKKEMVERIQERIDNGYTITKKDIAIPYTDKIIKVVLEDLIKDIKYD